MSKKLAGRVRKHEWPYLIDGLGEVRSLMRARDILMEAVRLGIDAAKPSVCLPPVLQALEGAPPTHILAVGKAAGAMAREALSVLGDTLPCVVVTRYGYAPTDWTPPSTTRLMEAAHPVPDGSSVEAALACRDFAAECREGDHLLCLVSGGASALLALPAPGVSLEDKQDLTRQLLGSGASIHEMNTVRKHLSQLKGGRLALMAAPACVTTLAISDVPGDNLSLIASGPTVGDMSKLKEARAIVETYALNVPKRVLRALHDPVNETPDPDHPALFGQKAAVIASGATSLARAASYLSGIGYSITLLGDAIEGEAAEVAKTHAELALSFREKGGRHAILSGGECTVTLNGCSGRGGPNGEYTLALALALGGAAGVTAAAVDTDGIDGSEDNAGAMIDPQTLLRAQAIGLDLADSLRTHRSYDAFDALGDLIMTGATQTNVNDLRIILIDA